MEFKKPEQLWRVRWYLWFLGLVVVTVILGVLTLLFSFLTPVFYVILGLFAAAVIFAVLLLMCESMEAVAEQNQKLEEISTILKRNDSSLGQLSVDIQLSETVKRLIYRDTELQRLRQAVTEKLHQQDFDSTYAMLDDIERIAGYKTIAGELRKNADAYRNATDNERANQVVAYIEKLFEQYQWTKASIQIERLIKKFPDSAGAKTMDQKLTERKEKRKKELLEGWDEAIKKQDTDRSLRVLKELDLYLTPSEGLALQEAASEMFKNKLHNLGVQFSLAVSDKHWETALQTGEDICHDFPNSKMSGEIRSKLPILQELAKK